MSGQSPDAVLYSSDGYELAVVNNATTPAGNRALMMAGSDGTNSRFILIDGSARQIVVGAGVAGTPAGGVVTIQGVSGGTVVPVSGTVTSNIGTTGGLALDATLTGGTMTTRITDGTNTATVKAASTAAVATDKALVVAVSPNNTLPVQVADVTASGALGALNAAVQITLAGHATSGFQLSAGTLIGTIIAEASFDAGTTWTSTYIDVGNKVSTVVFGSANTATSGTIVGTGGSGLTRIRVSAYTSGTANITLRASLSSDPSVNYGGLVNASVQPPVAAQIAGWDGANLRVLNVDTSGNLQVGISPVIIVAAGTITEHRFGFTSGNATPQDIRTTAYTEQTSAAQRSLKSSSANDTVAGTGARTVTIYYYDNSLNGPFTEIVTMNGTTPVNTVSTTIRFIEKMEVTSAGTGLFNAGTITLNAGTGGTGAVIGTIGFGNRAAGVGDNQTFWAHHYVRPSKTMYLAGMSTSMTGVTSGVTFGKFINPLVANAVEIVKTPAMGSRQAFGQYAYKTSIAIPGPGRFTLYNNNTGGNEVDASFEFQEQ